MSKALVVVDVQKDFVEGGSLAVAGGLDVAHGIHDLITAPHSYRRIVATKDWHNRNGDNGGHFHESPDFVDTWPGHCVAGSTGAEFAANLDGIFFDDVFHKGWDKPAYSGFEATSVRNMTTGLGAYLDIYGCYELDIVGIASTHCVKATVIDAIDRGYKVRVLSDYTVGVDVDGTGQAHKEALAFMEEYGATIV